MCCVAAAFAADVDAGPYLPGQARILMDLPRKPCGLVRGQRVHGVEEDGLDARLAALGVAVVEDGIEEALGFAGAGAGGDQSRQRHVAALGGQSLEGAHLVSVWLERRLDFQGDRHIGRRPAEGQPQVHVRPLEQPAVLLLQKAHQRVFQSLVLEVEGGGQVVKQGGTDVVGEGEGDHERLVG